jgi:proline iminopeptidase
MPRSIPEPHASGHTQTTAEPLYWARYGSGADPRLLVLHGGPGASHDYLLPQMLALTRSHELVFYDQRGGGRSRSGSGEDVTWRTHVRDLAAVVVELGLEPLSIVGYSWGALLALLYAAEAKNDGKMPQPTGLVLLDPAPATARLRQVFEAEFARRQREDPIRSWREELQQSGLAARNREEYRQRAFELSVAGYFADPSRARDLTPFRVIGKIQQSVWQSLGDYDVTDRIWRLSLPAMVVHGRQDPIPLESSEAIARALEAELVVLEDCGHVPYVERPEELFAAVNRFLTETQRG